MTISSDKANMRAASAVAFAARHRWAKYPCVAAVTAIYSAEYIRIKALELGEKIRESAKAPFRPLAGRMAAAAMSFAVAAMVLPFAPITAYAEEAAENAAEAEANKELPEPVKKEIEKAETPEDIKKLVSFSGLAADNFAYDIELNIPWLDREVTARFSEPEGIKKQVTDAFDRYGIPTDNLNIDPVDIVLYANDNRHKLNLNEGYSADITLPVADDMAGHTEDLKIVRLEDDGSMTIIEGVLENRNIGRTVTFNTSHFSVFAVVAYNNEESAENISSAAGVSASGSYGEIAVSFSNPVLDEDRRRFRKAVKRRIFRIKRIVNERDLLL